MPIHIFMYDNLRYLHVIRKNKVFTQAFFVFSLFCHVNFADTSSYSFLYTAIFIKTVCKWILWWWSKHNKTKNASRNEVKNSLPDADKRKKEVFLWKVTCFFLFHFSHGKNFFLILPQLRFYSASFKNFSASFLTQFPLVYYCLHKNFTYMFVCLFMHPLFVIAKSLRRIFFHIMNGLKVGFLILQIFLTLFFPVSLCRGM